MVFSSALGPIDGSDPKKSLEKMANYIRQLQEELEYKLANLDAANFNETGLDEISEGITEKTIQGLTLNVVNSAGDTVASIKLSSGGVEVAAAEINLSGLVTFTGLEKGTTTIDGGCIKTGEILADFVRGGVLEGVEINSDDGLVRVGMSAGVLGFGDITNFETGKIYYDVMGGKFYISAPNASVPMKIEAAGNMSIDAGTGSIIYLGTSGFEEVNIGSSGNTVRLYGDVYINGVLQ